MTELLSPRAARGDIDRLLRPRSIAVIGASSTPGSLGASVLLNLENARYAGQLYLVNPKRPKIGGRVALGSVEELPQNVDCAVLAIPGAGVLDAVRACAKKAVASVIIFSAGFAESGREGRDAQRELAEIAKTHGMVVEGPNCLGMVNYLDAIPLTFVATRCQRGGERAGAAILSQSGALAAVLAVNMRGQQIPLTYSVTTGNEAASGIEDYLEHLVGEESTRVFALVVEQFRDPRRMLDLARRARSAGRFIVLLHPGRSWAARASAVTHTGAMAGNYEAMRTLASHAGIAVVESLEELVDVTQILVRCRALPRGGAAVFTESGAFKALALDLAERVGLPLPELTAQSEPALRAALPAFIPPSNPLDITAQGLVDPTLYRRTLPAFFDDPAFGSVLLAIILTDRATTDLKLGPILDALRTLRPEKPVVFAAMDEGAAFDAPGFDALRSLGVACFPSPERSLRALARLTTVAAEDATDTTFRAPVARLRPIETGPWPEYKAKALLSEIGIPVPPGALARTLADAAAIAREVGFPVALKAQSADLPHKTEAGGVMLHIASEGALGKAWQELHERIQSYSDRIQLDGILVEKMAPPGLELIAGARRDADWGPVLLVGLGGVFAEVLGDVRLLPPDLSVEAITRELHRLRGAKLFGSFRGRAPLDVPQLARIIAALGQLVRADPRLAEIDINPLVLYPEGQGAVALDALIVAS